MPSKTKLYRVLTDKELQLAATFEGPMHWHDARLCAMLFAEHELTDLIVKSGKAEEPFKSRKVNVCPCCRQTYRLRHLEHRRQYGTTRCDCGTLFQIDFEFTGTDRPIVDIDSDDWQRYLCFVDRQVAGGATLGKQDERGIQTATVWLNQHKRGWFKETADNAVTTTKGD